MKQQGFTLIELIVVIVILGILAATALPKFLDVQKDAKIAAINGAKGAIASAANLAHAQQMVAGSASNVAATLGGVSITMSGGYPDYNTATGIFLAANIIGTEWTLTGGNTVQLLNGPSATCQVVYTNTGTGSFTAVATTTGC